jgi:hypothetical protein
MLRIGTALALAWWLGSSLAAWGDDREALRHAITDLGATHGERYPARAFLDRLAVLEQRGSEGGGGDAGGEKSLDPLRREALLSNPRVSAQPVLFVVRHQYQRDHHNTATFFPAAQHEYNDGQFTPGSALKLIDLAAGGGVTTLLEVPRGVVRDPEVHFDGRRIVFSMRTNAADSYHLYEIQADGTGLRQLTFARDVDDFDPAYLPDGGIVFSSTREPKYCMCNRHLMANLYRMDGDGGNIHQIGKSTLFEGHAALMPDGRILYDRWEYVDRNFGDAQALWTVNPDGTSHALYWGNNTASPGAVIDARIIPGTDQTICVFGSCHDRPWGALAILDRSRGLDGPGPVLRTWPAAARELIRHTGWEQFDLFTQVNPKYEDPFPLDDKFFLAARMTGKGEEMGIYLLDVFGHELLLHVEGPGCFDPMPLAPRPRPPILPTRRDYTSAEGYFYVQDVYQGTHMQGVEGGAVKWLRVVESPEKRFWTRPVWGGQGIEGPAMAWHDFNNKRILGTVPVEADGSVYFAVPAERFVYFQLLDEAGMMIQSMRSGVMVQPGETAGCIGCHEDRRMAPPGRHDLRLKPGTPGAPASAASSSSAGGMGPKGQPQRLRDWYGPPREFSFRQEVQPVLDRHCLDCHDFGGSAAEVLTLAGDRDLVFNTAYNELWRKQAIQVMGAGPSDMQPAYGWGSHASKLGQTLLKNWRTKLTREEFDRLVTWVDLNAPYYPTYASAYPDNLAGRSPLNDAQLARLEQLTGVPLRQLAGHRENRGPQVSFDRPEVSPCLARLPEKTGPEYQEALGIIRAGRAALISKPEADADGFQPCAIDQWREQKYLARRQAELRSREALREGRRIRDPLAE